MKKKNIDLKELIDKFQEKKGYFDVLEFSKLLEEYEFLPSEIKEEALEKAAENRRKLYEDLENEIV